MSDLSIEVREQSGKQAAAVQGCKHLPGICLLSSLTGTCVKCNDCMLLNCHARDRPGQWSWPCQPYLLPSSLLHTWLAHRHLVTCTDPLQLMNWHKRRRSAFERPTLHCVVPHSSYHGALLVLRGVDAKQTALLDPRGVFVLQMSHVMYLWQVAVAANAGLSLCVSLQFVAKC